MTPGNDADRRACYQSKSLFLFIMTALPDPIVDEQLHIHYNSRFDFKAGTRAK